MSALPVARGSAVKFTVFLILISNTLLKRPLPLKCSMDYVLTHHWGVFASRVPCGAQLAFVAATPSSGEAALKNSRVVHRNLGPPVPGLVVNNGLSFSRPSAAGQRA